MAKLRPDLVTVTIGGNDVGFSDVLRYCYYVSAILHRPNFCVAALHNELEIINAFGDVVSGYYNAITTEAGYARVVIVGYPRLFPREQSSVHNCGWLSAAARQLLNSLAGRLDRKLSAAARGIAAGAEYVSMLDALRGHELCTRDSWVNPITINGHVNYAAHPNLAGQVAIEKVVQTHLDY